MKKQLMSALVCATIFMPGAQAMLGGRTLGTQPTSFRRADVANKVAEHRDVGTKTPTAFRKAAPMNNSTAFRSGSQTSINRAGMARPATAPLNTVQTSTAATTPAANKFSLSSAQSGFSSVSSAPGFSSVMPESGSSQISEGLSSASTFQGLKQTTGSTAPAQVQNVMQSAPAQRATSFFQ